MRNAIEIKNLSKTFDGFSLKNVNINVPKGYIMGFIGPNGAGKSTTINLILDLINVDNGTIKINEKAHNTLTALEKESIGVVLDESCFAETLNVLQIQKVMANIYKNWDGKKFEKLRKSFTLPDKKLLKDYSKGMKMKLSIAVALSHNPKILILDEATSGLDPIVRDEILDLLLDFVQNEENSVLLSSHIISDLEKICDYITFINKGEIVFSMEKDKIAQEFAIIHASKEHFSAIDRNAVIGVRENNFGVDALVYRRLIPQGFACERPTIEDVMLYHIKGGKR